MLGNRVVHFRYLNDDEVSFETNEELHSGSRWSHELQEFYGSAWRHVICGEDCPENQEDMKRTTSEGHTYWIRPHHACESDIHYDPFEPHMIYKDRYYDLREMMRLSVLRSCRQIFVEANYILWTTNTFSFADATTFSRFMMTRTINQKRSIKSLRLQTAEWALYDDREWNKALNMALVRSLSGLRRLRLHIEHKMDPKGYEIAKRYDVRYTSTVFEGLKKFSTLPLTEVEIVVRNPECVSEDSLWTKVDRQDFAEGFRKILLNPKGAQNYAEEQLKRKEQI